MGFWSSVMSTLMMLIGTLESGEIQVATRPVTVVYGLVSFTITHLIFVNAWIAVLVWTYQTVRVRSGFRPNAPPYKWKAYRYVEFTLWRSLQRIIFAITPIKKPT